MYLSKNNLLVGPPRGRHEPLRIHQNDAKKKKACILHFSSLLRQNPWSTNPVMDNQLAHPGHPPHKPLDKQPRHHTQKWNIQAKHVSATETTNGLIWYVSFYSFGFLLSFINGQFHMHDFPFAPVSNHTSCAQHKPFFFKKAFKKKAIPHEYAVGGSDAVRPHQGHTGDRQGHKR